MKKITAIFLILLLWIVKANAQQLLTFGVGFSGVFYQSEGLDRFEKKYNQHYQNQLNQELQGFDPSVGLRVEIGYRSLNPLGFAVLAGLQNYIGKDLAQFGNFETRNLELKLNSLFLEGGAGYTHNNFFINGVTTFFFNRKIMLKSTYSDPANQEIPNKSLSGNYKGDTSVSTDIGFAVGFYHDPILLIGKITYPIFTAGKESVLQDKSVEKVEESTSIFPDNYEAFLSLQPYHGVDSNIDGLKILLIMEIAIPLGE